ncbi:MAG TPA: lantibiotic ABC transporter permease, partial [Psychrobacter sp.]|nr:lantibiotic ABC transporter permease [Psychrobacter sp.]
MLRFIARHSTLIMPLCAVVGFIFPDLSNEVLAYLPEVLFFLMFFTLLGIDQYALLKRIATRYVWSFAVLQSAGMSLILVLISYALGVRGDLLLAIAGLGATAPLFGSGALVNAVGFDAQLAMAKTIAATLVMPCTLLGVLWLLGDKNAHLDLVSYVQRLVVYIIMPMVLAVLARHFIAPAVLSRYYPKIGQFNILLLLLFPLGLMAGFRETFDHNPWQAFSLLMLSSVLALFFYFSAYFVYR